MEKIWMLRFIRRELISEDLSIKKIGDCLEKVSLSNNFQNEDNLGAKQSEKRIIDKFYVYEEGKDVNDVLGNDKPMEALNEAA